MAHFAKIENEKVVNVIVVKNEVLGNLEFPESEPIGQEFIQSLGFDGTWLQTSYNGNIRKNYAGIGYTYDEERDAFIAPKPHNSWILNEDTCQWEAPVPMPEGLHIWNETNQTWEEVVNDN